MSLFAKIMIILNFILAVAFLAAAGTLLGAAEDYKGKYETSAETWKGEKKTLDDQVTDRDNKLRESGQRFNDAEKQKAAAESQLRQLSQQNEQLAGTISNLQGNYTNLSDAQKDLQAKLADQSGQINKLRDDLSASESARKEADGKVRANSETIARLEQDNRTAEQAREAADTARTQIEKDLEDKTLALERAMKSGGRPAGGTAIMKDVKGVVQAVNNQVDIYVISVGSKDNVEVGYEFTVYRGNEYISTIVIDKVFPNYASGSTKAGTKRKDAQPGDEVATRL